MSATCYLNQLTEWKNIKKIALSKISKNYFKNALGISVPKNKGVQ